MTHFDHEKLDAYEVANDFVVLANDVAEALPRARAGSGSGSGAGTRRDGPTRAHG